MIKLSDGQVVKTEDIKQVTVDKGEGCKAKWHTRVRLYPSYPDPAPLYSAQHDTREEAMAEVEAIYDEARAQGVHIGVRGDD